MIDGHSVLGVILARGGSKGLPRKNIRDLAGKPLIAWTIEAGHESEYLDRLILSSDDGEIMEVAEEYGCEVPFQRPAELAQDDTPSIDTLLHAIEQVESHDYIVLLQPTSPLRTADDIDATMSLCHRNGGTACVTVTETDKPPQWMYILRDNHRLEPVVDQEESITRRQAAPDVYVPNGAVYAAETSWLQKHESFYTEATIGHPMPPERSADVDTALDLAWCELLKDRLESSSSPLR
ncbi:cytidylyltransferase domain-containing protein [Salinibacter ruber]|uniref:CMP-N-acetlyneuraminic acid synthetase n=1 Tax=Salinibacter ruber (strain DSM 13855 / M31) TaxID=309807 RepID=Q2S4Y0_SALRD|nr:acylneuraminate cytidylyltransferase family protein [Salinibacter ruber]ABC43898.1 CMP-N-acetlyneuraminic acid synthetase [Salinibacter ruber DSM 13855]